MHGLSLIYTHLGQLKFLIEHLRAQEKTCKLILISHGCLQILVGTTTNFLNLPYDRYPSWACSSWLTSVWPFMSGIGLTINVAQAWLPPTPSGNDMNLMDYFTSRSFSLKQLKRLNCCRVYLQLLMLSDLPFRRWHSPYPSSSRWPENDRQKKLTHVDPPPVASS
jgi:hypothetical protein